jgi:glutamyl-tRNA synthetase
LRERFVTVSAMDKTRLAPSPTGALHLGNARTFLINWLLARQNNWKVLLRVEDIDGPRIKKGADQQAIDDLRWLGIDWDEGPVYQSRRMQAYGEAVQHLLDSGHAYPCVCSRSEVNSAASAPHAEDGAAVYPGTCRGKFKTIEGAKQESGKAPAVRFRVPDGVTEFEDRFRGHRQFDVSRELGDFVIAKADGTPAYQLAVVVDDAAMRVTQVVRGDDLIDSTPRQILLYQALGLTEHQPDYWHFPLVTGTDGRRLAKRHGDTRLSFYRERGIAAGRVLALLARWCGISTASESATAADLVELFDVSSVPRETIVFAAEDDAWLRGVSNST